MINGGVIKSKKPKKGDAAQKLYRIPCIFNF